MTKNNLQPRKNNNNSRTSRRGERIWCDQVAMDTPRIYLGRFMENTQIGSIKPRKARNRFFNTTSIYKFINSVQQGTTYAILTVFSIHHQPHFVNSIEALTYLVHSKEPWIIDSVPIIVEDDWQF
ncbi:hypothetical protein AAG906_007789 [Vitis piasezkii]